MTFCKFAFDHQPNETCPHCEIEVDRYGNTAEDFRNCSFPDCGCDGQRLCMAPSGANQDSLRCNVEGMYRRTDKAAVAARLRLMGIVAKTQYRK